MPRRYSVLIGEKVYSAEFQQEDQYATGWQRVLARAKERSLRVSCLCRDGGRRPLSVHECSSHYHLAKFPRTGPDHRPDCIYFSEGAEGTGHATSLPGEEAALRRRLTIGFKIVEGTADPGRAERRDSKRSSRRAPVVRISLGTLLRDLWIESGLADWHPKWSGTRNLFLVCRRLLRAAAEMEINGGPLNAHLLVGAVRSDCEDAERNRTLINAAAAKHERLALVARMARFSDREESLRLFNFHGLPWISIPASTWQSIKDRYPEALALGRAGSPVFVLAIIEPTQEGTWFVVDAALQATNADYVPHAQSLRGG